MTIENVQYKVPSVVWWRTLQEGQYIQFMYAPFSRTAFQVHVTGYTIQDRDFVRVSIGIYLVLALVSLCLPTLSRRTKSKERVRDVSEGEVRNQIIRVPMAQPPLSELMATVRRHPDDTTAWLLLARRLMTVGEHDKAHDCYMRVLQLDPSSVAARTALAQLEASIQNKTDNQ